MSEGKVSQAGTVEGATNLFRRRLDGLFYEVHQVWRAQLSQRLERLGARFNGRVQLVLVDPVALLDRSGIFICATLKSVAQGRRIYRKQPAMYSSRELVEMQHTQEQLAT